MNKQQNVLFPWGKKILSIEAFLLFLRIHTRHFSQEILSETVMSLLRKQVCFYLMDALNQELWLPLAVRKLTATFVINEQDPISVTMLSLPYLLFIQTSSLGCIFCCGSWALGLVCFDVCK